MFQQTTDQWGQMQEKMAEWVLFFFSLYLYWISILLVKRSLVELCSQYVGYAFLCHTEQQTGLAREWLTANPWSSQCLYLLSA
jgi:hypothetical protein